MDRTVPLQTTQVLITKSPKELLLENYSLPSSWTAWSSILRTDTKICIWNKLWIHLLITQFLNALLDHFLTKALFQCSQSKIILQILPKKRKIFIWKLQVSWSIICKNRQKNKKSFNSKTVERRRFNLWRNRIQSQVLFWVNSHWRKMWRKF